ncbi:hypothetical protein DFS34DRAFT_693709 [Phlyctochytrium arcticum]|nr:hypothetical protein DFS34DRAFT_693709 [Phlyctochytrium arcticum]
MAKPPKRLPTVNVDHKHTDDEHFIIFQLIRVFLYRSRSPQTSSDQHPVINVNRKPSLTTMQLTTILAAALALLAGSAAALPATAPSAKNDYDQPTEAPSEPGRMHIMYPCPNAQDCYTRVYNRCLIDWRCSSPPCYNTCSNQAFKSCMCKFED